LYDVHDVFINEFIISSYTSTRSVRRRHTHGGIFSIYTFSKNGMFWIILEMSFDWTTIILVIYFCTFFQPITNVKEFWE
jgi:hypothetical protein